MKALRACQNEKHSAVQSLPEGRSYEMVGRDDNESHVNNLRAFQISEPVLRPSSPGIDSQVQKVRGLKVLMDLQRKVVIVI